MDLSTLLALKTAAEAAAVAGTNTFTVRGSAGDLMFEKQSTMSWDKYFEEINYALSMLSPNSYAPKITRTRIRFS